MLTYAILVMGIIFLGISLFLCFDQPSVASMLFNFFTTVIVSWLISNLANEKTFKKKQEDLAKVSHRHLGDVEKSALSIEQSIKDFKHILVVRNNPDEIATLMFLDTLDSRMDDLKDRIKSTNRDWYDLLADNVKKEIDEMEDPEAKLSEREPTPKPDLSSMACAYRDVVDSDRAVNK